MNKRNIGTTDVDFLTWSSTFVTRIFTFYPLPSFLILPPKDEI